MAVHEGPEAAAPTVPPPRARSILFVCSGYTCRSPLAEALGKRLLADRLGCAPAELEARGFVVRSAGVAAAPGDAASATAVVVAEEFGADLSAHRSRFLTPDLLAAATDVIAMTRGHALALELRFPGIGPAPALLCGTEPDLDDPIGGEIEVYRECARTFDRHLDRLIKEWTGS
jgi:protein-tyrosine phosphatase